MFPVAFVFPFMFVATGRGLVRQSEHRLIKEAYARIQWLDFEPK